MSNFYRAFEDELRGSRDVIKSRLRVYLPFVKLLKTNIYPDGQVVDLGCGRGEWLEILKEADINFLGVDLDDGMISTCHQNGLNVEKDDLILFLKRLPSESQVVVSGFHLVEHLDFTDLQTLVQEALRVLKPAGLLILETPNPENILVGTSRFYLDPTHRSPIPPETLSFLLNYYGFKRVKVLRLQESKEDVSKRLNLMDVLNGVSPDYSVVAQKNADGECLAVMDEAFTQEYGLTLEAVAIRYQEQLTKRLSSLESSVRSLEASFSEIVNSRSWRLTAPLRSASRAARAGRQRLKTTLIRIIASIVARPKLKSFLVRFLDRVPRLKSRLALMMIADNSMHVISNHVSKAPQLSPRAAQILEDLKQAMKRV
ncbi:MAG: SAM-dependent methyltransferase [Phormidesmis priestleyi]|uniref:SAM-dependent methyltransferase n=1 Tax=Phormidesmis priestleyi TaxID=268141 RepID=A0A2W4XQA4_9CYAN|nr:MAG: SAM-dependent methyltransferase [Phormidesmis priestleyi]